MAPVTEPTIQASEACTETVTTLVTSTTMTISPPITSPLDKGEKGRPDHDAIRLNRIMISSLCFRAKACPGRDPGWIPVRVKKTRQNKEVESPFRFKRSRVPVPVQSE